MDEGVNMLKRKKHKQSKVIEDEKYSISNQVEYSEIYRQLRTSLEYSSIEKKLRVVNITSTNPEEGKSSVASNLAKVSMAKYKSVLLIDCDLRKPVLHKIFQVSNSKGLSDLMVNFDIFDLYEDTYFQKFKDKKSEGELCILTAGTKTPNPQELLSGEKFKQLLNKLKERFEFIVIDCPPILSVADAIPVSNISDGTIFVISAKDTNKNDAKMAVTQLDRNGAHILGSVLTKVERERNNHYYYYYESN